MPRTPVLAILILLGLTTHVIAQRIDFDRLKKDVLEAQSKREKATAMLVLGSSFSPRQADLTFTYADSILLLTEDKDSTFFQNASKYLKAVGTYRKGKLHSAKSLFQESFQYFDSEDDAIAHKCLNFIGIIYMRTSNPDSAVATYNQLLKTIDPQNIRGRLSAYGNLGKAHKELGDYAAAIDNFELCVKLDSTNRFSVLNSYMNIAGIFADMDLFEEGIKTLRQGSVLDLPDQPIKAAYFNNLGELFFRDNQYDSAIVYLSKGFLLAKKINQNQLTLKNRLLLSKIFLEKDQPDSAKKLLDATKADLQFYPTPPVLIDFNLKNASYFLHTKGYDSAIHHANEVLKIAANQKQNHQKKNTYELLALAYEGKGDAKVSTEYFKKHAQYLDSLNISDRERFAQDAKARYLVSQKEAELALEQAQSRSLKTWQWILFIIIAALLCVSVIAYLRLTQSRNTIQERESQNETMARELEKNKSEIVELKSRAVLPVDDIISIKADGHYLEFHLVSKQKPEIDRNRIKSVLEILPSKFVQIHRSYIVNIDHIKIKYADKIELKDGKELPVSRTFKESLAKALGT